ncbi:ABC-2 family transporter protein [compost metagenome]
MIRQLKFEVKKLIFQSKYWIIWIALVVSSILYSVLLYCKGLSEFEIVNTSLAMFRPICWLLSSYIICEIVANDYHYKLLKTILPYAKSRSYYIISKLILALGVCLIVFLISYVSISTTVFFISADRVWTVDFDLFLRIALAIIAGILCFASVSIFFMIFTESEVAVIGISMGAILIMLVLESIEPILYYLPTMWLITLPAATQSVSSIIYMSMTILVFISLLILVITIKQFQKKDLFVF